MKKIFVLLLLVLSMMIAGTGCELEHTQKNVDDTETVTEKLIINQPTPTDMDYSLERYNLIKRAYWVNGQREKALEVICPIKKPVGYITLFTKSGEIIGTYEVDGKVTSLNSYLSPDSRYYTSPNSTRWLADVDGSYGENQNGIFWFTTDNHYMECTGDYLYSDTNLNLG